MNKPLVFFLIYMIAGLWACSNAGTKTPPADTQPAAQPGTAESPASAESPKPLDDAETPQDAAQPQDTQAANQPQDKQDSGAAPSGDDAQIVAQAQALVEQEKWDDALRMLLNAQYAHPDSESLRAEYQKVLDEHPLLHAEPKALTVDQDVTHIKRIGGGSSLVYKLLKDKVVIAAFKPFQKRFQSNYRAEIAAYRLCPLIRCGFDIPTNIPVYFDFKAFSGLYARLSSNPKEEFVEIIPTRLPDGTFRVDGTYKDWIPDFADFPIEFTNIWKPWLNPGTSRSDLSTPVSEILPEIAKRHKLGTKYTDKLSPHLQDTSKYQLARQISNMLVLDFLINNWDRFSGAPTLYGVNCQIAHGRFMSIDNGAGFPKTPSPKPDKHLHEISRFSRITYNAIQSLDSDRDKVNDFLFPNPSDMERERLETFWKQRQLYLDYVQQCIKQNGEAETFFFE